MTETLRQKIEDSRKAALEAAIGTFAGNAIKAGFEAETVATHLMVTATLLVAETRGADGAREWLETILAGYSGFEEGETSADPEEGPGRPPEWLQ
ncbi:hypothetical protein [Xanthobacter sp. KR7-225]|uniref:hypothetical protein n=1 Tax=Xanthobacter sp. KR7-225 TaxID=3156613 RepID=UPI0032B56A93